MLVPVRKYKLAMPRLTKPFCATQKYSKLCGHSLEYWLSKDVPILPRPTSKVTVPQNEFFREESGYTA